MYLKDEKTGLNYYLDNEVYLIAQSNILQTMHDYMKQYNLNLANRNDLNKIEFLPEFAGRHCYMSFNNKVGNKTNESYIKNILEHQHFSVLEHINFTFLFRGISRGCCYDDKTEVLTKKGWKFWKDVTIEDEFATIDKERNIYYSKADEIVSYPYKGKMYQVKSLQVDLCVTPNHFMYVKLIETQKGRNLEEVYQKLLPEFIQYKKIKYMSGDLLFNGEILNTIKINNIEFNTELFMKFLAHYINARKFNLEKNVIFQTAYNTRKIISENLKLTLEKLNIEYTEEIKDNIYKIKCNTDLMQDFGYHHHELKIPENIKSLNAYYLEILFNSLIEADETLNKKNIQYHTSSKQLADDVQEISLKIGKTSSIKIIQHEYLKNKKFEIIRTASFQYNLYRWVNRINHNDTSYLVQLEPFNYPYVNKINTHKRKSQDQFVDYDGIVYCAILPKNTEGLLIVRRNGFPIISCNSHEIVRHRHLSFSQLSTRYSDEINFVIPNLIRQNPEKIRSFLNTCFMYYQEYNHLLNSIKLNESSTLAKKKIRSCARSLLPHSIEAPMVVSGNLRSFRETIQKRCTEFAELEISQLFNKVKIVLKETCPNSMSDIKE